MQSAKESPEMFCFQCEETSHGEGCTTRGVCGKSPEVANLQDLLVYLSKGISVCNTVKEQRDSGVDKFINKALFSTITNANFDREYFVDKVYEAVEIRDSLKKEMDVDIESTYGYDAVTVFG